MTTPPRLRVVLDTDTYNEVDDQFALAHLLLSPERIELEAVYAAPFSNPRSKSPADGMERSHEEIGRVLGLVGPDKVPPVFRGSTVFMSGPDKPVESAAAHDLVRRAMAMPEGEKLHVAGIAAATNLASALLIEPRIAGKIVVIWLGGHAPYWHDTNEFNLKQDPHAARVLLDGAAPLVLIPCNPVTSHLLTTVAELREQMAPYSHLGAYLTDIVEGYVGNPPGWSKPIWDISASAWLIDPEWVPSFEGPSPKLRDDLTWEQGNPGERRTIQIARQVRRNAIFADFFAKARTWGESRGK
jgi:inosine-uridine nucleoside N-ribohydrolase